MIEGITILAQEEILNVNEVGALVAFLGFAIIGFLIGLLIFSFSDNEIHIAFGLLIGFAVGLTFFIYTVENGEPTGEYKYRVIVDETVSMTEFYERYEILDQDGLIYEIKERDNT